MIPLLKNFILLGFLVCAFACYTQTLDASEKLTIKLSDSSEVYIYKSVNGFDETSDEYYYLPSHLKFSVTKSKEPEFSLLMYAEKNGNQGGILHFLTTWGLTLQQRNEAESILRSIKGNDARLMGAVTPELDTEHSKLYITGSSPLVDVLNTSATTIGKTPTFSNSKTACSFKLNSADAQSLKTAIDNNSQDLKDIYLSMHFVITFRKKGQSTPHKTVYKLEQNLYKLLNTQL
ncbi:hypothetical protein [Hyunsoonleella ulvae]|uniref:hypothetical protein n=1 Tax=Hyunsoonleella ulvae TaxID=2799948 RepID=UPI0019394288|nr:hypothetical protein [Hyunsoonleella ulvae]